MKIGYAASLVYRGLAGGALRAEEGRVSYWTGKLTLPPEIRGLRLPYAEVEHLTKGHFLCFPTVSFSMQDGQTWKFIVFGRKSFLRRLAGHGLSVQGESGGERC